MESTIRLISYFLSGINSCITSSFFSAKPMSSIGVFLNTLHVLCRGPSFSEAAIGWVLRVGLDVAISLLISARTGWREKGVNFFINFVIDNFGPVYLFPLIQICPQIRTYKPRLCLDTKQLDSSPNYPLYTDTIFPHRWVHSVLPSTPLNIYLSNTQKNDSKLNVFIALIRFTVCKILFTNRQIMSKQLDDKIEELIKLTFNHDPDRQYMAIMELAEIIKTQSDKIAPAVLQKIIDNILKFLQDQNKILHGLAIDRLSKIITKIPTEGNRRICQQMISKLSDLHTLTEFRGIYATALKSIIKQVSFEQGSKLAQLLIDVIKAVLATQNGTHPNSRKIQQLLIEVVDTFITKWPTMIDKIDFPKIKFAKLLLNNIVKEGHLTKSNASSICLGRLAGTMKQNDLQQILYKPGGIIPYIDNKSVEDKKKKIAIDTFRLILQHYNRQMQKYVKDIFEFLFKSIRFYKSDKAVESDNDRLEVVCEIIEQLLFGVLSLLEHFPKELKLIILNNQQYGKDIRQMVSYCPIGSVNYMSNKVERDDDDDYDDQDFQNEDGACSYRVRSASTLIVGQLCRLDSNMCLEIIHFQKFYDRLLENSSEVRQSAFKAFSSLVHTITVEENTKKIDIQNIEVFPIKRARTNYKEVALDLVERLMKKLNEVTSKNSIDPKTTGEVAKLLSSVCQSFAASISDNPKLYEQVTVLLQKELARNSSFPQIKSHIIDAFGYLFMKSFNERPNFTLDSCTKLIKSCIDQNSNEVSLAAFKAIDNLLENNILEYGGQPDTVKDLGKIFVDQLKVTSYKTQTKKYIVQCVSQLLSNYNKLLDPQQINDLINQLISKLETEASKKSIIVVFTKFEKDFPINKALTQTLNKAILAVSNGYINHQNQSIAVAAQEAVAKMIDILGKSFPKQNAVNLVQAARHIKGTFPLFMHSILNLYPDALKQYLQELFSFEEIPVDIVQKLITSKVLTNDECLKLVKAKLRNQNIDTMVKVLSLLGTDIKQYSKQVGQQTPMGRLALRFLGDFGGIQTYNQLKKYALGSYQTQTKQQGSIALGSLVSRHFSKLMPDLINNTLKSLTQQHVLNVFLSVREAIVRSGAQNYDQIDKLFEYILAEIGSGNISKDAVLNLIAESVARMVSIKHEHSERLLDFIYKSKNSSHRYLFAKMFQSLSQQLMENTDYIRGKIALLIKMLAETDVNIKTETLKSLVHLTEAVPHAVLYSLDEETFKLIRQCTVIDKSLFKTQVMVVTVVVDYGRPIRFQAFGFFETAINKPTNEAFELQSQHPLILQSALDGLEEQKQLGMIQVRLNLIKTLTDKYAYVLVGEAARLKKAIEPRILNMDPEDRFAKNILGTILNIYRNMKKEFSVEMEELYQSISKKPELKEIITHIEKEYE